MSHSHIGLVAISSISRKKVSDMTKTSISASRSVCFLCALILAAGAAAEELPTILRVDVENYVIYTNDVTDLSKLAQSPGPLTAVAATNFGTNVILADVTAINGSPAKGVMVVQNQGINLTPTPTTGRAISDVTQATASFFRWEFLKLDGSPIGSIFSVGMGGGTTAPGSPLGSANGNNGISGGTGAYVGARGTVNLVQFSNIRSTSQAEDPSMRRINGGGKARFVIQIWPMFRPEIVVAPTGPAVVHSGDFTLVTAAKPAKAGEILSLFATGLGPVRTNVDPGSPFPTSPLALVNSPVEVMVNGKSAEVLAAVGYPGSVDGYQVNFRIPAGMSPGMATLQVITAWIPSSAVSIAIQ
jgi:hypothetical protein